MYIAGTLTGRKINQHHPSLTLFARDCKFTENGVRLPLGKEGLWYGMSGKGTYKFYVPDIETQQIAFIGTAREGAANKWGQALLKDKER